jgi:uncharacterized protein YoaH (UPF0181 family)
MNLHSLNIVPSYDPKRPYNCRVSVVTSGSATVEVKLTHEQAAKIVDMVADLMADAVREAANMMADEIRGSITARAEAALALAAPEDAVAA